MEFPHGQTVERDRRKPIPDPYNPDGVVPDSWDDVDTIALPGGFVSSSSSFALQNATRSQILTAKSLFLTDTTADVAAGDRIRAGGVDYYIHEKPAGDVNPFTGWAPYVEIPLEDTEG